MTRTAAILALSAAVTAQMGAAREVAASNRFASTQGAQPTLADADAPWRQAPLANAYRSPLATELLIRNATILDGAGSRIDEGDLLVQSGKIAAIGVDLPNPSGAREIDATGRWLTPGVIDIHSHDGVYVFPLTAIDREAGDVAENSPDAADVWVESGINPQDPSFSRALESGVTMLQILPGSGPIFAGHSAVVRPLPATTAAAMKVPGAAFGFKMSCGENPKAQAASTKDGPTSRPGVVAYTRQAFLDARIYLDAWRKYRLGRGPAPARDLKREALAGILAGDIRVHVHCYRADDMASVLGIADEFGFHVTAFHHASEAYKIAPLLKAHGTCSAVWGDWWGFKMEVLDGVRANAPLLERAGACVTMHSDSPGSGQRLNIEAAKAAAAGRRAGVDIPPERMIRWTTSVPAAMLGLEKRVGTLAPGFGADIVLWSANPFSIYSKADLVLIDGGVAFDRQAKPKSPASDFELGRSPGRES